MEKNLIRAILAHDDAWGIGKDGDLPWAKNSDDLQWFKACTHGQTVIMGRHTWESLPPSLKPLPNRLNVIVTTNKLSDESLGSVVVTMEQLISILPSGSNHELPPQDIWIIGGAQLINSMLFYIDELWLNRVGGFYDCDVHLPRAQIEKMFYPADIYDKDFGTITKWKKNNV